MCVSPRKTLNLVDPRQPQHWSTFTHTRNVLPIPIMTQVEEHTNYQSQSHQAFKLSPRIGPEDRAQKGLLSFRAAEKQTFSYILVCCHRSPIANRSDRKANWSGPTGGLGGVEPTFFVLPTEVDNGTQQQALGDLIIFVCCNNHISDCWRTRYGMEGL